MDPQQTETSQKNIAVDEMDQHADHSDDDDSTKLVIDTSSENDFQESGSDWSPGSVDSSDDEISTPNRRSPPPKGTFVHPRIGPPPSANRNFFEEAAKRLRYNLADIEFDIKPEKETLHVHQATQTAFSDEASNYCRSFKERQKIQSVSFMCLLKSSQEIEQQLECLEKLKNKLNLVHERAGLLPKGSVSSLSINKVDSNNEMVHEASLTSGKISAEAIVKPKKVIVEPMAVNPPILPTNCADMIPIGSGRTKIPRHIYDQIKWNSYSAATRKLLMAVFPRKVLATHSLTGKSSPAFSDRAPKMKLDTRKVTDIIMVVTQLCSVQENVVRNIITTKCSDENKMYRMRMKKQENHKQRRQQQEL